MFLAELFGTMTLIVLGDGVVANNLLNKSKGQNSGWIVVTTGWGLAVMGGVFVSTAMGGPGSLNPAFQIASIIQGGNASAALMNILGEFAGAMLGALIVWLAYMPHWAATEDKGLKLGVFCTAPAIRNYGWNFVTEIVATFMLGILATAVAKAPGLSAGGAPLVGAVIWALGISLGGPTGYSMNPARDLGPRIMHAILPIAGKGGNDWAYSWVGVVGPIVGAILAGLVGAWIFA
jgi:glycerol uptake facilitator protein